MGAVGCCSMQSTVLLLARDLHLFDHHRLNPMIEDDGVMTCIVTILVGQLFIGRLNASATSDEALLAVRHP